MHKASKTADWFRNLIGHGFYHMIVRFCYAVYLQLLNQHNQEFRPYIPDPLSHGAREGLGTRLEGSIILQYRELGIVPEPGASRMS